MQLSYGNAYCQYRERECSESHLAPAQDSLFFGYPSVPESTADALRNAIEQIREADDLKVDVVDWRDLPVEAAGAVDAENAPTAPWKTARIVVFHSSTGTSG